MKNGWIVSSIGSCIDCDARWEDQTKARSQAAQHSKKTGHRTMVEVARAYHYPAEGKR